MAFFSKKKSLAIFVNRQLNIIILLSLQNNYEYFFLVLIFEAMNSIYDQTTRPCVVHNDNPYEYDLNP